MQMLHEERRKEEEEQRREEAEKAEIEREQSSVDSSATLVPNPSATSEVVFTEDVNNKGQVCRQAGGGKQGTATAHSQKGTAPSVPRSSCDKVCVEYPPVSCYGLLRKRSGQHNKHIPRTLLYLGNGNYPIFPTTLTLRI